MMTVWDVKVGELRDVGRVSLPGKLANACTFG